MIGAELDRLQRERHEAERSAKRAAMDRLRREDPDAEKFVRDAAGVFGRLAAVEFRFSDGTVFSSGGWGK